MGQQIRDRAAYERVTDAFKRRRKGATVADIVAVTALPLATVRELAGMAADEYSARLEVTESGEIRYSFPRGFTSKYRGFSAGLRKFLGILKKGIKTTAVFVFKVWIMVMLVGYFVLFMLIALASLLLSMTVHSSGSDNRSSNRGGGVGGLFASSIFNMIIRIWFYSELLKPLDSRYSRNRGSSGDHAGKGPLYKAIFSFVFGDGDPNADWSDREKQGLIAYIQANRGVISLPEFMTLTGLTPEKAEEGITACCVEFGGLPEITEGGTLIYRFDELLLRSDTRNRSFPGLSAPIKRLRSFSSNLKKMNLWFSLINGANLIFGGYFLINALRTGHILTQAHFEASSYLYGLTYILSGRFIGNPLPVITFGLGFVPLVFSILFWLIPGIRYFLTKRENENIKLENLRKDGYRRIWNSPLSVQPGDINPQAAECRPKDMESARHRIIREFGSYVVPDVTIGDTGGEIYSFGELDREKKALEKYRDGIDAGGSALGATVFDSDARLPEA
ncbi:MAG: hypothetical protein LBD78_07780 [Spirochaetaceae bacterium]|jgi:hypothetical protein|nr:hypothetical protein [Spirochaetaceae bacterium]